MELKLKHPYTTAAGQKLEKLTLRRLKVKDLRAMSEQAGKDEVLLEIVGISRMCGLAQEDLDDMDAADYQQLKARFLEYLGVTGGDVAGDGGAGQVVPVPAE